MAQSNPSQPPTGAAEVLLNQAQPPLAGLVGYAALYYIWADGLQPFAVAAGRVVGELTPKPGFHFQALPLSQATLKLTETPKESRHGETYQVKLQGERPQPAANVLDAVATMGRRPVVCVLRQHDGQLRVVGSPDEALQLRTTGQGQHPGTRAGLDLLFTGLTTRLAPYYTGPLLVAGQSVAAPLTVGAFRVLDSQGNVRLVVPAGYDLIVRGPFRVDLLLQPS